MARCFDALSAGDGRGDIGGVHRGERLPDLRDGRTVLRAEHRQVRPHLVAEEV